MVAVGLSFFAASLGIDVQEQGGIAPRVFPMAGALLIAMLGAMQVGHGTSRASLVRKPQDAGEAEARGRALDAYHVAGLLALSVAYVAGINYFGYLVSTAAAAPVALCLFGIRSIPGLCAAAVLCPAIYHLVFFVGLGVFPPYGLWFDLLDVIPGL
ncbi:MAG: tripartite tricarboxylate transporter TctB family protein [Boseongicola sp. SB0673_bin_14]|nr:tripartite tricarboxylate transporter TctB family protein [Boseongicola sp. SB0667_bin_21]MYI70324.1 tripartite tricarboxylate transporter TctB family protein [Boseongicola sp. SB0673_bin_14]